MTGLALAADLIVRAGLLTTSAIALPFIVALLADQVSLIRKSITKENTPS